MNAVETLREAVATMVDHAARDDTHVFEHDFDGNGWSEPFSVRYSCWCGGWKLTWVQTDPEQSGRPEPADALLGWYAHASEAAEPTGGQVFVASTGQWWEPLEADPDRYRTVAPCDDDCHHPVHAFGHPERLHHTEDATWVLANAAGPSDRGGTR